jgi:hypothetical protein
MVVRVAVVVGVRMEDFVDTIELVFDVRVEAWTEEEVVGDITTGFVDETLVFELALGL